MAAVGAVVLALCAACSSTDDELPDAASGSTQQETEDQGAATTETTETPEALDPPDAPDTEEGWIPGGEPLGLKMTNPVGSKFEAVQGLTVTVPEDSVEEDSSTPELKTVTDRFPGGVDDVPALQVASAGGAQASIYEETWVQEKAFATMPQMS